MTTNPEGSYPRDVRRHRRSQGPNVRNGTSIVLVVLLAVIVAATAWQLLAAAR